MIWQLCLLVAVAKCVVAANFEEVFAWKEISFVWPSEDAKNAALKSGEYIPVNNLPLGIDRWRNKLFITIPRWKSGAAATLAYVPLDDPINKTAALIPYPDRKANEIPKEGQKIEDNQIISTFRVSVDACDRLWVIDVGKANVVEDGKQIAPPAIIIFDLKTDKLVRRYNLKDELVKESTFFTNIVTDSDKDSCDDAYAYISDVGSNAIIVYSLKENDAWRVTHNFFHMDPLQGDMTVGGVNFQWTDGVFGLALGPRDQYGDRTMYFHPLASLNEFSVNTSVLKNKTVATSDNYKFFKIEGSKGENTQTSASVFDEKSNVLILTQLVKDGLACWNPKKKLIPENVPLVAQDKEKMIFTNDVKIDSERNLWAISNKMPTFVYKGLNPNEVNYRIFRAKVDDVIAGTPCTA